MSEFFQAQIDYIFFFYGLGFMLLGAVALSLGRGAQAELRWGLLGLFGLSHGLNEWLDLVALSTGDDATTFKAVRLVVLALSFAFLLEFARSAMRGAAGRPLARLIHLPLLLLVAVASILWGLPGANAMSRYMLGLPAGLWAGMILFREAGKSPPGSKGWLASAGIAMGLYAVAAGAIVPDAAFAPASLLNQQAFFALSGTPIQLWRGLLACWIALSVFEYSRAVVPPDASRLPGKGRLDYFNLTAGVLLVVLVAGWIGTELLGRLYEQDARRDGSAEISVLGNSIEAQFASLDHFAEVLSADEPVLALLADANTQTQQRANQVLARYNKVFQASVSYVINDSGRVLASSNSEEAESFVGQNYGFRPYFRQAMAGQSGRYFALGITSGKRGFYTSHPIRGVQGDIIGAAVIKKDIDRFDDQLASYRYAFLVDPDGVVFLSSRKDLLFKTLWPLREALRQEKRASRQFGDAPLLKPIFRAELINGARLSNENEAYLVVRQPIGSEGWSLVRLKPMTGLSVYRLIGISIALLVALLPLTFFALMQIEVRNADTLRLQGDELSATLRENEVITRALRESETRYRTLFEHLQSGFALHEVVTDDAGKPVDYIVLAANDAYGRMTGLEPARILGKRVTEFYPEVASDSTDWIGVFGEVALTGRTIHLERFAEGLQRWYDTIAYQPAARQFAVVVQDITERKLAEAAVSESETRHRTVLAALGEGVYGVDSEGRCTFINRAAAAMLGFAEADVLGQDQHALFHHHRADGQPYPSAECPIHKTVCDGQVRRQEEWFFHRDGTGFPVEMVATFLAEGDGGGGAVVAFRDISERRQAEDELRKLSLAVEQSTESIVITDLDARIEYVNEAFLRNTGYRSDEVIGQNPRVLHSSRTPAATYKALWAALAQGSAWRGEFFNRRKDGSEYVELARVAPIRQPDGRITHYLAIKEDVTERKATETTIERDREQQQTLRKLLENTLGDGALEEILTRCLTQVMNVSWLSILPKGGIFLAEEDGKSLRLVVAQDLSAEIRSLCACLPIGRCHCGQAAETGRMQYAQCVDSRHTVTYPGIKDHGHYSLPLLSHGKVLGVMVLYLPVGFHPSSGKEQFLASVAGILAGLISRKYAEANLIEHQAHLEELVTTRTASLERMRHDAEAANRAKSAFLAAMSHEIRTPMNGVLGMIDLLGQSELNADQRDMTQTAGESARSLLAIIDDILDFSKIEAGKLDLDVVPVSLAQVVEGVGEALAQTALKKNVELLLFCDPGIPQWVSADPVRLRQILFNLAGNAVKFTGREDGKTGKVFIRADLMASAGNTVQVCLRVIDNGIGMSKEAVQTLFKPFTQAESSTTRRFGGTGLGLSISQRLTNLMGGSIEVQSTPGVGSTFGVALDFERVQGAPGADRPFDLDKLAIVVVAPGQDMREILVRYLESSGARVLAAQQPDDAVEQAYAAMRMGTPWVVVVADVGRDKSVAAVLRTRFSETPELAGTRFVMIERGRRHTARAQGPECVSIDADALRRSALLQAVAIAAGRASPKRRGNEATELLPPSRVPSIDEAQGAGRLILVAEDNRTNQKVIERQLHLLGYAVEIANDGQEALAMLRRRRYGLVLTDCHMPNMDGFELTAALRREQGGARTPIIAITANALKGEDARCLAAGMDDYLSKPVQLVALRDALEKWLPAGAPVPSPAEPAGTSAQAQPLPSAAAVNPDALKEIVGDDPDVVAEFLSDFVLTAREAVSELQTAYAKRSDREVGALAHKLKSSARTVGADALADLCQELEQAGKTADWAVIDSSMPTLAPRFAAVEKFVETFVAQEA